MGGPRIAVLVFTQNLSLEEIFYTFGLTHIMMENTKVLQIWVNCSEPLHRFNYWTRLVLSLIIHELLTTIVSIYFTIENDYILWLTVKTLSYPLLLSNLRNKRMIKISRIKRATIYLNYNNKKELIKL